MTFTSRQLLGFSKFAVSSASFALLAFLIFSYVFKGISVHMAKVEGFGSFGPFLKAYFFENFQLSINSVSLCLGYVALASLGYISSIFAKFCHTKAMQELERNEA